MTISRRAVWLPALAAAITLGCQGISDPGCLAGDDGACVPSSPCTVLSFSCEADAEVSVRVLEGSEGRPAGEAAQAAAGDILLSNSRVSFVLDAIDTPHHIAPSGGAILDAALREAGAGDQLNSLNQGGGILPADAAHYTSWEIIDKAPLYVAVVARGELDGRPGVQIVTRYELRPCDPGVRIRTELHHGGRDPYTFFLFDSLFYGDRQNTPFIPLEGQGFIHPSLSLLEIGESFREIPFMAAQSHTETHASYALVSCDRETFTGFQNATISAGGVAPRVLMPGDSMAHERLFIAAGGPGLSPAVDDALEARELLFGEPWVEVRGRVVASDGSGPLGGDERIASLLIFEPGANPSDPAGRRPWTEVVPAEDGTFSARLPAGRTYAIERYSMGRPVSAGDYPRFSVSMQDVELSEPIEIPPTGLLTVELAEEDAPAEIVLTPVDASEREALRGSSYGYFDESECSPWLGPAHGGSPGCNRVVVDGDGVERFAVPPGEYWVYATRGPFWTLDRARVTIESGAEQTLNLDIAPLELVPEGALSADFHVHSGLSFDSQMPKRLRALTLASQGLDVIAATEHDRVTSFDRELRELGLEGQIAVMAGMEATPLILDFKPPGADFPKTIGHYNFWPLRYDPDLPRGGGPDDELAMPGELFQRYEPLYAGSGVRQMNHPFADILFGRDEGFARAINYDPRVPVASEPSATPSGYWVQSYGGLRNIDHHAQEVMNGASTYSHAKYRTLWFSFLNQGILRAGTANSDSHTLGIEVLGYPRNIVYTATSPASFNADVFNASVRGGRFIGTNGPMLDVSVEDAEGDARGPSLSPFTPSEAATLHVRVSAAPWIPVTELRIFVNGARVRTLGADAFAASPSDPFGDEISPRLDVELPLSELLEGVTGDAWIVVEAGLPELERADLDDDGVPDTTDSNGDGVVNEADHAGLEEDETWVEPERPTEESDPRYHLDVVAPGVYPTAYTNPFLIDRDGEGWDAPGLEESR